MVMEFNPDKCEVIRFTNKRRPIDATYSIHGKPLARVDEAKYLGVRLHHKLQWKPHVEAISKKANSTRAFLQRNLRGCPAATKDQCYKSFVRPILEYASTTWDPCGNGGGSNRQRLEGVQRRCARFVTGDWRRTSSVSAMMAQLNWASLAERRAHAKVHMMYNIFHGHVDIPASVYLIPTTSTYSTRGAHAKFLVPYARLLVYKNSFIPSAISLWNRLPASVSSAASAETFKARAAAITFTH